MCDSTSATTTFYCDPKFYVTWFGTDLKGNQLQSANLSMARFKAYSIGSLFNSAKGVFNSTMSTIQTTYSNVASKVTSLIADV